MTHRPVCCSPPSTRSCSATARANHSSSSSTTTSSSGAAGCSNPSCSIAGQRRVLGRSRRAAPSRHGSGGPRPLRRSPARLRTSSASLHRRCLYLHGAGARLLLSGKMRVSEQVSRSRTRWTNSRRREGRAGDDCFAMSKEQSRRACLGPVLVVSMKEAVVVKGVWGVSPEVIAGLPGEAGRVKRLLRVGARGRPGCWRLTRRAESGSRSGCAGGLWVASNAHLSIASSGCEDQVSWEARSGGAFPKRTVKRLDEAGRLPGRRVGCGSACARSPR